MLRYIKILLLLLIAVALVVIAVANSQPVVLSLLPDGILSEAETNDLRLANVPLFAVLFGALLFGILIGEMIEWSRERKYRRLAAERKRALEEANARIRELARKAGEEEDLLRLPAA